MKKWTKKKKERYTKKERQIKRVRKKMEHGKKAIEKERVWKKSKENWGQKQRDVLKFGVVLVELRKLEKKF